MIDEKNLLPLAVVPDFADPRVRNWSPAAWGEWRLADAWLGQPDAAGPSLDTSVKSPAGAKS